MKNCICSQLEMSRVLDFDPKIRNVQTLVPKNVISPLTSPPYSRRLSNISGSIKLVVGFSRGSWKVQGAPGGS